MGPCEFCQSQREMLRQQLFGYLLCRGSKGSSALDAFCMAIGPSLWLTQHLNCCEVILQEMVDEGRIHLDDRSQRYFATPSAPCIRRRLLRDVSEKMKSLEAELRLQRRLFMELQTKEEGR